MNTGNLIIIAAPSGAGKTSLVEALLAREPNVVVSISHTTRTQRAGEVDGENYFFITQEKFDAMIAEDCFLEHAKVFDYAYGTSKSWVNEQLTAGRDVILEIDWQGAQQVRETCMDNISIFILPPSLVALEKRLKTRALDDEETINRRMQAAQNEISHYAEFDYVIVNDDFETALVDLQNILRSQRLVMAKQSINYAALISELL